MFTLVTAKGYLGPLIQKNSRSSSRLTANLSYGSK